MNQNLNTSFFADFLHDEGLEFAIFDAEGRLIQHSGGLVDFLMVPVDGALTGQKLSHLFPELIGYEQSLQDVQLGAQPGLQIERIHRGDLRGAPGYVTFHIRAYQGGWLLVARNVTPEGQLEQKVTQQRNELSLLSGQLKQARTQLDDLLRRFVPSAVVDHMLTDVTKTQLGGERREITVLFADLRGFTNWSENRDPEMVMDVLNQALGGAVSILLKGGATLDKFMGDALMAVFNAPLAQTDHATLALRCAKEICINQKLSKNLRFGIGINTGSAVVGNIGAAAAMNYTALGDAVNIAKRLEELTAPGQILVGPRAHELADPQIPRVPFGHVKLRGRQKPVAVYEVQC
ncbi:MAG TPA: hypothetical protein DEH25_06825 [Chloroflexi bacterium]|nr:hypothetical protein [Chloroflexota bacterium]